VKASLIHADRQTGMRNLTGNLHEYANAPKVTSVRHNELDLN